MNPYYPSIPSHIDLFAICVNDNIEGDSASDFVNYGRCYKVLRFVIEDGFFPYGVRISDFLNSELQQTFYTQRFIYLEHNLN